jgi:hypothetical protein
VDGKEVQRLGSRRLLQRQVVGADPDRAVLGQEFGALPVETGRIFFSARNLTATSMS